MNKLPKEIEERFREIWRDPENRAYVNLCNLSLNGYTEDKILSFLATILEEERARLAKEVEGMKKRCNHGETVFDLDWEGAADCAKERESEESCDATWHEVGYNTAIDDFLSLLSPSKDKGNKHE